MAQVIPLINTLKKALKLHGKTYAHLAEKLGLSEASVKRMFSEHSFSLERLDQACQMMDMEISELVQMMGEGARQLTELTREQEEEIANDLILLLITVCVLNRWTMSDILRYYDIAETDCIRHLVRLDKLEIIELLPRNRIKLLVSSNFSWCENGPIQKFFQSKVEAEFFNSRFDKETESLLVVNGMLASNSNAVFQRKMQRLVQEFNELNDDDAALALEERFGTTVVLAIRQWQYGVFAHLRKRD